MVNYIGNTFDKTREKRQVFPELGRCSILDQCFRPMVVVDSPVALCGIYRAILSLRLVFDSFFAVFAVRSDVPVITAEAQLGVDLPDQLGGSVLIIKPAYFPGV
jgi:hypothetical protein